MANGSVENVPMLFASNFRSVLLKNEGKKLQMIDLPLQAQFSPVYSIMKTDANLDGWDDIILTGNLTQTRVRFGRYDANHGMLFLGNGKCGFTYVPQYESGLNIRGDVRSSLEINDLLIFGVNADSIKVYKNTIMSDHVKYVSQDQGNRKSVVTGKRVSVRVNQGGR